MSAVPARLLAQEPGWETDADVVVIGTGVAGLTAALRIKDVLVALPVGGTVLVVTKDILSAGSTQWAQGGIAAALGDGDTPDQHLQDTLVAGAGICDEEAVRALVTEGPEAVRELIALGAHFDQTPAGELSLTREGGHHRDRIAHAGGDATGAEIQRALVVAVHAAPEIRVVEHAVAVDLIVGDSESGVRGVAGVTLHVMGAGRAGGLGAVRCRAVVLATGGLGQVFSQTTNPPVSTGDGMALALRAGAVLRDLEFVQFHPTVMYLGPHSQGQQPLISEAVRGEGAFLVDWSGNRFMQGQHELADLAPRDVVAKAITRRMLEEGKSHMWLDARHLGGSDPAAFWQRRFPTILSVCRSHGVDPVTELIPVAPACHYASGGVATDLDGQSSLPGLAVAEIVFRYVLGEVAVERPVADGSRVRRGEVLLSVTGATALLLTAERTALNFVCHLSGVATATADWTQALRGTSARVRDTRKTVPGLRHLEKYAVRAGGGVNHRTDLSEMALVKDNHVLAAGGVVPAWEAVRAAYPDVPVQVEVDSLDQLRELLAVGVEEILLDNMDDATMAEAVRLGAGRARFEASGGLTLERAAEVGATGVDFIAVGALTHSARVLDIAMDLRGPR